MNEEDRIREAKAWLDLQHGGDAAAMDDYRWFYEKTKSPRWLFHAVKASSGNVTDTPEWVLAALLEAARSVAEGVSSGPDDAKKYRLACSMDKALGITSERGKASYTSLERKRNRLDDIFYVIEILRASYEVNVEEACESAYYFLNLVEFSMGYALLDAQEYADQSAYEAAVSDWHGQIKTYGEHYGASLDSLIDRYYREGAAYRSDKQWTPRDLMVSWAQVLERIKQQLPDWEAWTVPSADARRFRKRPEFATITDDLSI